MNFLRAFMRKALSMRSITSFGEANFFCRRQLRSFVPQMYYDVLAKTRNEDALTRKRGCAYGTNEKIQGFEWVLALRYTIYFFWLLRLVFAVVTDLTSKNRIVEHLRSSDLYLDSSM